jgi:hypothetical protein
VTKPKDAPTAPPAEIIPPAKTGRARAAMAKLGLVNPKAAESDPELEGLMAEIESDMREEELRKLWQRHGKTFIAAIVLILIGIGAFQYWREHKAEQRLALAAGYDQATKELVAGKTSEGLEALAKIEKHSGEGFAAVAALQRAATLLKQNDVDGAVAVYKNLAADPKTSEDFRELATILRVLHSLDRAPPKELEALLTPMLNPASPFNPTAMELSAVLAAKQGDTARAVKMLDQILEDQAMPPNMLARDKELRAYYASLPQTAPPPSPAAPSPPAPAPAPSPPPAKP